MSSTVASSPTIPSTAVSPVSSSPRGTPSYHGSSPLYVVGMSSPDIYAKSSDLDSLSDSAQAATSPASPSAESTPSYHGSPLPDMIFLSSPRSFHGGSSGYDASSGTSWVSSASSGSPCSSDEGSSSSSGSGISHHSSDKNGGFSGRGSNLSNSPGSSGDQEDRSGNDESDEPEVHSPEPSNNTDSSRGNPPNGDPNLSSDSNSSESPSNDDPRPVEDSNPQHVSPETLIRILSSSDNRSSQSDGVGPAAAIIVSNAPSNVHNIRLNSGPPSFVIGQGAPAIVSPIFNSNDGNNPASNNDFRIGPPVTLYRSTIVDGFSSRSNGLGKRQFLPADLLLPGPDSDLNIEITPDDQADEPPICDIKLSFDISEYSKDEKDSAQGAQRPNPVFDTCYSCSGSLPWKRRRSSDTDDEGDAHDVKRRNLSTSSNVMVQASTITHTSAATPQGPHNSFASPSHQGSSLRKRRRSDNDDYDGDRQTRSWPTLMTRAWVMPVHCCYHTSISELKYLILLMALANKMFSEIPDLYHSGMRPRPHYDWYEQYHAVGFECAKVHGCTHNPGRHCHRCHAAWQRAWSQYFKAEELLNEAAANPESYLEEMDIDMRQDYMGVLMQGSGWEVLAPELQPPAGGSLRLHPTRIAKHRLALAQMASAE
jgi:hypothetical protein